MLKTPDSDGRIHEKPQQKQQRKSFTKQQLKITQ
jgi:hypothetical protein